MPIDSNNAATSFVFPIGLDRLGETADRVNEIGLYLAASPTYTSNPANYGSVLTLAPIDPLPSGLPTGSVAMSGSNANLRAYVYGYGTAGSGVAVSGWRSITPTA
jgi:hypothetical protein